MRNILPINQKRYSQGHKIFIVLFVFFVFFAFTLSTYNSLKNHTHAYWGEIRAVKPDSKRKGIKKQRVCSVGQESITVLLYLLF